MGYETANIMKRFKLIAISDIKLSPVSTLRINI